MANRKVGQVISGQEILKAIFWEAHMVCWVRIWKCTWLRLWMRKVPGRRSLFLFLFCPTLWQHSLAWMAQSSSSLIGNMTP